MSNSTIDEQAADWVTRLTDDEFDPQEPYPDPVARNNAFTQWVSESREHLRVFLEMYATYHRLHHIDARGTIRIEELLAKRKGDVICLQSFAPSSPSPRARRWLTWLGAAAAVAAIVVFASYWRPLGDQVYSTGVGEQQTAKLDDGSFVILNTNTRVEARLSAHARNIELARGEALFIVQHDASRPFWVHAGSATVRAVGTQFSIRRRADSTDVSVVEGVVQIAALDAPTSTNLPSTAVQSAAPPAPQALLRVTAGEEAQVTPGHVTKNTHPSVPDSLAWRQRRLIFHDATLAEIADEFNRYNQVQVIVQGSARERRFSGIFDADHPEAIALYAGKDDSLSVHPQGNNWIITTR